MNSILCSEHDPRAADLRRRLDKFYETTQTYEAFQGPNHMREFWDPIHREIIAAPRYDFPFYLSPSVRHCSMPRRLAVGLWLPWQRLRVMLGRSPRLFIHVDPAVLQVPWFRHADAFHWASWWDLKRHVGRKAAEGYSVRQLRLPVSGALRKVWEKYLLLFARIDGAPAST